MRMINKRLRSVQLLKMTSDTGKVQAAQRTPIACIVQSTLSADFWISDEVYRRIVAWEQAAQVIPAWLL